MQIRTKRHLWLFIGAVTAISVITSEGALLLVYLIAGDAAFGKASTFYTGILVPVLVAGPVSYLIARMAWQLNVAHAELKKIAHIDELTGLTNRRSFFQSAESILENARAEQQPLSLLVIDADYFKQLNDTYGHATGDAALQFITEQLNASVRKADFVCRLGGEEFAILLPGLNEAEAAHLGKRILEKISSRPMFWDNKIIEMSVSCGIADSSVSYEMTALFKAADDALYAAKTSGRNRQILFSQMPPVSHASGAVSHRA